MLHGKHLTQGKQPCRLPCTRQPKLKNGATPIDDLITLTEASERLARLAPYLKGACEGIGVKLMVAGQALVMTRKDFDRLRKHVDAHPLHRQRHKARDAAGV